MIDNSKQLVWVTSKLLSNNALSFATMYYAIQCKTKPKNYETNFFFGCAVCFNAIHKCGYASDPFANKPSAFIKFYASVSKNF